MSEYDKMIARAEQIEVNRLKVEILAEQTSEGATEVWDELSKKDDEFKVELRKMKKEIRDKGLSGREVTDMEKKSKLDNLKLRIRNVTDLALKDVTIKTKRKNTRKKP